MLGIPVDFIITGNHGILDGGGADIPGLLGIVEERSFTPPAEGIGMLYRPAAEHQPP